MYPRRVSMKLKPNSTVEFTQRLEKDVIPMLRKQSGFRDEITFVAPGGTEAFGVSLWDNKQSADTYDRGIREVTNCWRRWLTERLGLKPTTLPTPLSTRSPRLQRPEAGRRFGLPGGK